MHSTPSTSLPGRPWTPPEDAFPDTHAPNYTPPLDQDRGSVHSPRLEYGRPRKNTRPRKLETRTHATLESSPEIRASKNMSRSGAHTPSQGNDIKNVLPQNTHPFIADPITPNKTPWSSGILPSNGIPQYPYTPESVRTAKSHDVGPLSPLPSMPWSAQDSCSSPMQEALLSCASNLESLILSREPTDEQMEYLITKFEEMAGFLSAPDSQSKQTDDHLFSEPDGPSDATGLGIVSEDAAKHSVDAYDLALSQGYVLEVGKYIESVRAHVQDLTMRMDEVKQLNSIQLDIISDLRKDLKNRTAKMKQEEEEEKEKEEDAEEADTTQLPPLLRNGFWASMCEALDSVSEVLHEW